MFMTLWQIWTRKEYFLPVSKTLIATFYCFWAYPLYQTKMELSLKHLNQKLYGDSFCFEKNYMHWKLFTLNRPSHLLSLNGKNNGFTTND